jgi:cyclopropane fatty-acyl-phospholipid synthase-like methyltransferase
MRYKRRIPKELMKADHYLGRPADFSDEITKRRIRILQKVKQFCKKEFSVLDIGCGNGASMFLLSSDMKNCYGVDIEKSHYEEFLAFKKELKINNCYFEILDIEKERISKQFERIISFEVIEHLRDEKSIKVYYDLLQDGGLIAITVPNKWWIFETHGAKLPLLPWNRVPFFSWLPQSLHERWANARIYTRQRIIKLLQSGGFTIQNVQYITAPLDVLSEGRIKRFLKKFVFRNDTTNNPLLSTSIFVVATKK